VRSTGITSVMVDGGSSVSRGVNSITAFAELEWVIDETRLSETQYGLLAPSHEFTGLHRRGLCQWQGDHGRLLDLLVARPSCDWKIWEPAKRHITLVPDGFFGLLEERRRDRSVGLGDDPDATPAAGWYADRGRSPRSTARSFVPPICGIQFTD
jgi:hypothetical protein